MRTMPTSALLGAFFLLLAMPASQAANSAIDPDPRSPSLGELLAREDAARAKAAPRPAVEPVAAPLAAPSAEPADGAKLSPSRLAPAKTGVRQVYPQPAVTVLVPGARMGGVAR